MQCSVWRALDRRRGRNLEQCRCHHGAADGHADQPGLRSGDVGRYRRPPDLQGDEHRQWPRHHQTRHRPSSRVRAPTTTSHCRTRTTALQPDSQGDITLAPAGTCTFDTFFLPGALGARPATVNIADSSTSGVTLALNGVGTIGYYQVNTTGTVSYFGDAGFFGDLTGATLNKPIVGIAQTGDDGGYWLAASDGGIFNFGDAGFFGSAGGLKLNKPVVGIAPTSDGGGYWLVATDGGIFDYGDAPFYGSTGSMTLNAPIVGMAATPDGGGYWLVASDGGIFAYGDAQFYGSTGSLHLNKPIVGMAATPDGGGYWLVASDGGIFAYGDAQFYGSTGNIHLAQPIVGMAAMPDGGGYWFSAADGGLFNYGTAPFFGASAGANIGVVGMATDGAPTLQAFSDLSGERAHADSPVPLVRPLPANVRHYAGG